MEGTGQYSRVWERVTKPKKNVSKTTTTLQTLAAIDAALEYLTNQKKNK